MFFSASHPSESTYSFILTITVSMFFPGMISAAAQGYGPPPPFKPVVTIRYGGAYNGPRYAPHRTILGLVKDGDGQVVSGAMVYLKDVQGKSILVATVDSAGAFHFGSLSLEHDYEIWAEAGELKSSIRSVTTFMTQNEISMPLLVRTERNHGTPTLIRRSPETAGAASETRTRGNSPAH
ncbi:carboxypeptidase-like regulatory domain-containing protein [Terriglobus sp. RCC_193]|uniref:carboxypeptidase-like regulatory domain-containing protein n=1 Tax=Terriglobus sp. RCC_193 TaxID=3239218 RepID=UPI0035268187